MVNAAIEEEDWRSRRLDAVVQAILSLDITNTKAWDELDALSSITLIDDIEVDPAGIVLTDNQFKGLMNLYILLQYGGSGVDAFETSDSFRAQFFGHFENEIAVIDDVDVDTSPFFAGEERE